MFAAHATIETFSPTVHIFTGVSHVPLEAYTHVGGHAMSMLTGGNAYRSLASETSVSWGAGTRVRGRTVASVFARGLTNGLTAVVSYITGTSTVAYIVTNAKTAMQTWPSADSLITIVA